MQVCSSAAMLIHGLLHVWAHMFGQGRQNASTPQHTDESLCLLLHDASIYRNSLQWWSCRIMQVLQVLHIHACKKTKAAMTAACRATNWSRFTRSWPVWMTRQDRRRTRSGRLRATSQRSRLTSKTCQLRPQALRRQEEVCWPNEGSWMYRFAHTQMASADILVPSSQSVYIWT